MRQRKRHQIVEQRGFSITELMVSVAIGGLLMLAGAQIIEWSSLSQTRGNALGDLQAYRQQLMAALANEMAWKQTLMKGSEAGSLSEMSCLTTLNASCNGLANLPLKLLDAGGNIVFDSTDPTFGLTRNMRVCNSWRETGNDDCPFRFDLRWSPLCTGASCQDPQVLVNAKLLYRPRPGSPNRIAINLDQYSINNFYPTASTCSPNVRIFKTSGLFTVPKDYHYLTVEAWGAGGGGASYSAYSCTGFQAAQPGGNSSFASTLALGGPAGGGTGPASENGIGCCFPPNGSWWCLPIGNGWCSGPARNAGGDGQPKTAKDSIFWTNKNSCVDQVIKEPGMGGQVPGSPGANVGAGGAGTGLSVEQFAWAGFNCFVLTTRVLAHSGGAGAIVNTELDGSGIGAWTAGRKAFGEYSRATLPPGDYPVVVGQGGMGGRSNAGQGGRGADGIVKITWW